MTIVARPPLTTRLRAVHWRRLDGLVGAGYMAILLWWTARNPAGAPFVLAVGPALVLGVAIALRRRHPVAALIATLAVLLLLRWPYQCLAPMWCALYCVTTNARRWTALTATAATIVVPVTVVPILDRGVLLGLLSALVAAGGAATGRHRAYEQELRRHRARQAEIELETARHGVAAERMRIARELHDVVAHSMSVITVQAGYGHLVVDRDPEQARAALGAIEVTGRQALTEMRQLLGVLRDDRTDTVSTLTPAPGLTNLPGLVAQTAQAGVRVELEVTGRARPLPAGIELSAYRIVQEALTNVVRHAHTPTGWVSIDYGEHELSIVVSDYGRGASVSAGPGHGLAGMRERVHLYGGRLITESQPGQGFHVSASIPLAGGQA